MTKETAKEILIKTTHILVDQTPPYLKTQLKAIQSLKQRLDEVKEKLPEDLEAAIKKIDCT